MPDHDKTLALIAQAVSVRQKLVDRVVAMIIESTPEVAADATVKECLSSLRLIQAALQKIASEEK